LEKNKNCTPCVKTSIGGQALIEGIMMRGPKKTYMAVRDTDGEIVLEEVEFKQKKRPKFTKWPFIRGVFNFIDSMSMGYKTLMRSAEISGLEEAEEEIAREKEAKKRAKAEKKALKEGKTLENSVEDAKIEEKASYVAEDAVVFDNNETEASTVETDNAVGSEKKEEKKETGALMGLVMVLSLVLGIGLAVGLFVLLPNVICTLVLGRHPDPVWFALLSGGIKVIILIVYMSLVSLMKDIKRTFMYHGAEHKTIFCYEQGKELTVENVREQSRFHPRCGTSFLFLTVFVSIVIMIFVGFLLELWLPWRVLDNKLLYTLIRTGIAILLVPLMAGTGYELIKLAGRHDNVFTRIISAPGLWMQRITTKEPDDSMIECAIAAMNEVIPEDGSDKI